MFEQFTDRARQVVVLADQEARALQHRCIGTEHLLLGLLRGEEGLAQLVLARRGVNADDVRAAVLREVGQGDHEGGQVPFTPGAKRTLELSLREALSRKSAHIDAEHLLLGLLADDDEHATRILLELGADSERIRTQVVALLPLSAAGDRGGGSPGGMPTVHGRRAATEGEPAPADRGPMSGERLDEQIERLEAQERLISERLRKVRDRLDALRAKRDAIGDQPE